MRENVNIAHLCLNIIFTGPCKLNILEFLAVLSVLQAVGICTTLWFRSCDKQELGVWGSFDTLIYKEAVCLVRPENTSPCRLRSDEILLLQIRSWTYGICCWCSASCRRMHKAVKISSLQPRGTEVLSFSFPVWSVTTLCQTRLQHGIFHNLCPFSVTMTNIIYFK